MTYLHCIGSDNLIMNAPILIRYTYTLCLLCLVLTLALPGILLADYDASGDTDPTIRDLCNAGITSKDGAEISEAVGVNKTGATCEQPAPELIEEARQEITAEIAEDTQNAHMLRTMLLGRNYIFFGRVGLEYAVYSGDIPASENGWDLRRLRFGIAGLATFFDRLSYKFELDLTDGTNNLSDLYVQWDFRKYGSIKVGNQRVSQGLSAMTSSLSQLFMERPLPATTFSWATGPWRQRRGRSSMASRGGPNGPGKSRDGKRWR